MAELAFWPAFQAFNFWKVPVRHQLLAVNFGCLLDATFLCWCAVHAVSLVAIQFSAEAPMTVHAMLYNRRIQQQDDWVAKVLPGWGGTGALVPKAGRKEDQCAA